MTKQQRLHIFKEIDSLPSLPATVSRVLAVTADPDSAAEDLVDAILPDQAMCATILKIANSAFFGVPRNVSTMDKAVTVLGFNEVHNIVLGKAVFSSFDKINEQNKKAIDNFWNHSFACGLAAKILAGDLGGSASELFIAGLIHDIGKLAFFIAMPEDYLPVLELSQIEQIRCKDVEQERFGIDHGEIGCRLLKRWLFPKCLINAVGFHHDPSQCDTHELYAIIIQLSNALSLLATTQDEKSPNSLMAQLSMALPKSERLWQQHNLDINEEQVQKWLAALQVSFTEDSGILNIFTS